MFHHRQQMVDLPVEIKLTVSQNLLRSCSDELTQFWPESFFFFFYGTLRSVLHIGHLPLAVVKNKTGGGELGGLTLLPALEAVEAALPWLEQNLLQTVQTLHQRRRVLIVGILGGVHGPSEPTNESLDKTQCQQLPPINERNKTAHICFQELWMLLLLLLLHFLLGVLCMALLNGQSKSMLLTPTRLTLRYLISPQSQRLKSKVTLSFGGDLKKF